MFNLRSLPLAISGLAVLAHAIELKDLPPPPRSPSLARRDGYGPEYDCLDLHTDETFMWGAGDGDGNAILGQLVAHMPGDAENIVSMERFKGMTASINCTQEALDIQFQDDRTFEYAKSVWDWVNGADNHSFVMVAGTGDCGWNDHRVPFQVFDMAFDEDANIAHLSANASDWTNAVHSYTLDVGQLPNAAANTSTEKRGEHGGEISLDFNHSLDIDYIALSLPPWGIGFGCSNCSTFGEWVLSAHIETTMLIPTEVKFGIQPRGVSMEIDPILFLSGDILPAKTFKHDLFSIPLQPYQIPGGILDLGPRLSFTAGVTIGPLQGNANIYAGLNLALSDTASATLDVFNADFQHSGWDLAVETKDVVVDARISAYTRAHINAELEISAKAMTLGYDVGLQLGPFLQGRANAIASTGAACADDPQQRHFGVDFVPTYGIALNAVAEERDGDVVAAMEIAGWIQELPSVCFPFGEPGNVTRQDEPLPQAPDAAPVASDVPLTGDAAKEIMATMTSAAEASIQTV